MFAWVPIATGILTALAVRRRVFSAGSADDLARALLLAAAVWGAYLALATEALSLAGALRLGPLLAVWALPIPFLIWRLHRTSVPAERFRLPKLGFLEIGMLAATGAIVAVTGLVAFHSAPNTWDSMTYHLPRAMHWMQNGSVAHYATQEPRQLYLSPWAELVAVHFRILGGGDHAVRLLQWLAMTGSLLAIATVAGRLGAGARGRILSVLAAASLPMGLLQAVSTQTDYVLTFQALTAVCFLSCAGSGRRPHLVGAALATGLAVLTKGTAYVVLAPFLALFSWRLVRRRRGSAWRTLAVFAAVVLAINLGHFSRNARLFASPLQPRGLGEYHRYANETLGVAPAVSNATRFAALHLSVPAPDVVDRGYRAVRVLHRWLGIDAEDPRTTWPGTRFEPPARWIHEDTSGNSLHAVLILLCGGALCLKRPRSALPHLASYALAAAAAALLFATLLKWTPWSSRLHLPLFALAAPVAGTLLAKRSPTLTLAVAAALVAQAVPFMTSNPSHPVTGAASVFSRPEVAQMLGSRPRLRDFYLDAARRVAAAECDRIGIDMPPDSWEYPLWVVLRQAEPAPFRLESLGAGNLSHRLLDPRFEPCAVVCLRCGAARREKYAARFGAPVLSSRDDLPHTEDHVFFLR